MASPPPDNGLTTARGSVALPRGRKTTATLRISELYANEGKVSIGGKAFKTLAIKVRGDRASLHQTVTVELFEATKKGRSGLPLHTFRIKHCTGLERSVLKKHECITATSDRCGTLVFREVADADIFFGILEKALASAPVQHAVHGFTADRRTSLQTAPSLNLVAENSDGRGSPSQVPSSGGGVRGAALRAAAAAKAQRLAGTTHSEAASPPPNAKGLRRKPSVYTGFSDESNRRSTAYDGFAEPEGPQRAPSIPEGQAPARRQTAYDGFDAGGASNPRQVPARRTTVYDGFDEGDETSGSMGNGTPPQRHGTVYEGFGEAPRQQRQGSVYGGFDKPIARRGSTYGGFSDRGSVSSHRDVTNRSSTVSSVYDGFEGSDDGTSRSDTSSPEVRLDVDTSSRPPQIQTSSGVVGVQKPRRRASAALPNLEETIVEGDEVATPPRTPVAKSPRSIRAGQNSAVGTDDTRTMTLPKGSALSHRESLLAESEELAAVAARLEKEIADLAVETDDDATWPSATNDISANSARRLDSTTSDLAFLLAEDNESEVDHLPNTSNSTPIAGKSPVDTPSASTPSASAPSNPFAVPEECSDCGEMKLDGWIDIAIDEGWYCKECWEAFAEEDVEGEDGADEVETTNTAHSVPSISVSESTSAASTPKPTMMDPRIEPAPITYLGQSVGLDMTPQAARKKVKEAASTGTPQVNATVSIEKESIRIVDARTGMALAVMATTEVKVAFQVNAKTIAVFASDGRSGVSQCFLLEPPSPRESDAIQRAFTDTIRRSEKLAIKDTLTMKRGRSGSVAFAKRASVRHGSSSDARARATLGQELSNQPTEVQKKQFSFRRRSVEASDNRKSLSEGALGLGQEDRAAPIALYKCKYLGAHIVDTENGAKVKAGSQMVLDAALQAASLVKEGSAIVDSSDAAIVISLGSIQAVDMQTSEELLTILPFTVKTFHAVNDKKLLKKLKPLKIAGFDATCMGVVHTKAGAADAAALTVELFCLGKDSDVADIGSLMQRVVRMDTERLQTRTLSAFDPSDPTEEENTDALSPQLKEIPREELACLKMLGKGEYGEVYLGRWERKSLHVAAKLAKKKLSIQDASNFLGEAEIMAPLHHANIVNLLGVQIRRRPWLIILEFAEHGALLDLLKTMRSRQPPVALSTVEQMYVGYQVASALHYLGTCHRLIHMDLASRNCLVAAGSHVKVADFGVAQIMDEGRDWWKQTYKMRLPGRWLAPECIKSQRYSAASDVWAFGILLWEMTSGGRNPYPGIKLNDVTKHVREGGRCPQLEGTDARLWDLMNRCWAHDYANRPNFGSICRELSVAGEKDAGRKRSPLRDIGLLSSVGPDTPRIKWVDFDGDLEL